MFSQYTRALALTLLALSASYSLYSMEETRERREPSREEGSWRILPASVNPQGKPVVLLGHKKKGYWTAFPTSPGIASRALSEATHGQYSIDIPDGDDRPDLYADIEEGRLKGGRLLIVPVEFKSEETLRKALPTTPHPDFDDFIWIPLDELVTVTRAMSKPLSSVAQKEALGKSKLAFVDFPVQQVIKSFADKIKKAAAGKPLPPAMRRMQFLPLRETTESESERMQLLPLRETTESESESSGSSESSESEEERL